MSRRCDGMDLPDYYVMPTRRPMSTLIGIEAWSPLMWDQLDNWQTSAEWLAWVKRRDNGKRTVFMRGSWRYPLRPIIKAQGAPWSTLKVRNISITGGDA